MTLGLLYSIVNPYFSLETTFVLFADEGNCREKTRSGSQKHSIAAKSARQKGKSDQKPALWAIIPPSQVNRDTPMILTLTLKPMVPGTRRAGTRPGVNAMMVG